MSLSLVRLFNKYKPRQYKIGDIIQVTPNGWRYKILDIDCRGYIRVFTTNEIFYSPTIFFFVDTGERLIQN